MLEQISQLANPLGAIIGFILTVMVLSYIIGDNVLFRLAVHIFIGAASGYAAVLIIYNVLWYQVLVPILQIFATSNLEGLLPYMVRVAPAILLGLWMMTKLSPRLSRYGTPVLAFLTGVGAATVIAGAVLGTIFPQVGATANLLDKNYAPAEIGSLVGWFINGLVIIVGTITTLIYFQSGTKKNEEGVPAPRPVVLEYLSNIGQGFIIITMGVLFTGVYLAALTALVNRISYLWNIITGFF
jgi:hypothetical protein